MLLGPLARMLGEKRGRLTLSALSMRTVLDGLAARLDESRELSRYLIGLLIFLGLLGTFWGLLHTVRSVGSVIGSLGVTGGDVAAIFANLQHGLEAPLTGMGWAAYGWHFAAGALVLAATFGLFALGGMGGGDAKLLSATALWMGFNLHLVEYLVVSALIGGLLTLAIVGYRGSALAVYTGRNLFLRNLADGKGGIPYGIALGIGGLVTYPGSPLMVWALGRLATQ